MNRKVRHLPLLGLVIATWGCAGGTQGAHAESVSGLEALEEQKGAADAKPPPDEDVVFQAARPFSGYRPEDDRRFTDEELITFLASASAICVGERHDAVLDHYAELRLLQGLGARRRLRGFELGLGLEMVRIAEQPTLSAYSLGKIDVQEFEELSRWQEEWGFPIQYYSPQLEFAAHHHVELLSLGVERDLTKRIAASGLDSLDAKRTSGIPEMGADDPDHRALFDALMEGHPMEEGKADNFYAAQLVWDEKMAELGAEWLSARSANRKLLIFAGTAHCHKTAIPSRIARRTGLTVVSVLPVDGSNARPIADSPTTVDERILAGYDYQMLFSR